MIVVDVDSASLARIRLTPSPAQELVSWLRLAVAGRRHPVYGDPGHRARRALGHPDVALVASVLPPGTGGYLPDLLTPQPPAVRPHRILLEQLDIVAQTSAEEARWQLQLCVGQGRRLPASTLDAATAGTFARRAASGLRAFWLATLEDGWSALRDVLDADICARSSVLARGGVGEVLDSLHGQLRWTGQQIEITKPYDEHRRIDDNDVVLSPSALGWPALTVQVCTPANVVVSYPAHGVGTSAGATHREAIADLLGASRARLLWDLAVPRSTHELSVRNELTPSTVSHHLGVLHRAGLVVRRREGRVVRYQRSDRGDDLTSR